MKSLLGFLVVVSVVVGILQARSLEGPSPYGEAVESISHLDNNLDNGEKTQKAVEALVQLLISNGTAATGRDDGSRRVGRVLFGPGKLWCDLPASILDAVGANSRSSRGIFSSCLKRKITKSTTTSGTTTTGTATTGTPPTSVTNDPTSTPCMYTAGPDGQCISDPPPGRR